MNSFVLQTIFTNIKIIKKNYLNVIIRPVRLHLENPMNFYQSAAENLSDLGHKFNHGCQILEQSVAKLKPYFFSTSHSQVTYFTNKIG